MTIENIDREKIFHIRLNILVPLFLVLSILIVYSQVHEHEFVGYDDNKYLIDNPNVQNGLTIDSIVWAFKSTHMCNWHPLTWRSHMLDVQLYGMDSGRHHMTNVLFHIMNSLLLFFIFKRMTGKLWESGFVAALFAVHPLHVESVAWVSERKDVLSTFFWMLTMWAYIRYVEGFNLGRYFLILLFFVLGLMSKPMLVTLPFVLFLLDYWPLGRFQSAGSGDNNRNLIQLSFVLPLIKEKIPLFILSIASSVITIIVQKSGGAVGSLETYPFFIRIGNALISYASYIVKMVWPGRLAVLYPFPTNLSGWQVVGACLLLISISMLAITTISRRPWFIVGWLWYIGTLLPVIGLIQVGFQAMADRYTYIPLIGLFIIVAWGIPEIAKGWRYRNKGLAIISAALFVIMIIISWHQVRYWKNSILLFEHTLEVTSDNYITHNNLGYVLTARGRQDEAIEHCKKALQINPDFKLANLNLGIALLTQGKLDECIDYYKKVLQDRPGYVEVHYSLGHVLLRKEKIDNAVFHFKEALRLKQNYAEAYNGLGIAMMLKGKTDEAGELFQKAIKIKPDYTEAQKNLDSALSANKNGQKE